MSRHHRVLVVGAGPAGSALALVLAQAGVSVLLVEQTRFEQARVGELLSPDGVHILGQMLPGLSEEHLQFPLTVASAWRDTLLTNDQDGSELPWRAIDRVGLDRRLAEEAEAQGATLRTGSKIRNPVRNGDRWQALLESEGLSEIVTADLLVDATGRASMLAKQFGAVRVRQSGQVALVGFLRSESGVEVAKEMILETTSQGWWYAAPIMEGSAVAVFVTDSDLDKGPPEEAWQRAFNSSRHVQERFAQFKPRERPRRVSADSSLLLPGFGEGWMAVGDAASCFDPLSIHGLGRALLQGAKVGHFFVDSYARGATPNPIQLFEESGEEFLKETLALSAWYRSVKQWPESLFWQRRDQGYPSAEIGRQKRRPRAHEPELLFASEQRFECQSCGRCQAANWPHLNASDSVAASADISASVDFPIIVDAKSGRPEFCQLEDSSEIGSRAASCAQFPFLLRETPDGIAVAVSPLCRSVQNGQGRPLADYSDWLRRSLEQRPPAVLPRKVAVTWGQGIDWAEYSAIEAELLAAEDLESALRERRWNLCLWAAQTRETPGLAASESLPKTFLTWLENLLVGALLCCLENAPTTDASTLFRQLIDDEPVHFARVGWRGRFSELAESERLGEIDWICQQATQYQRTLMERKFLVIRTPLLHNLCLLSVLPSFLLTYSLLLSMHRGAPQIERRDYFQALEIAEMELVTYGRLDQLPHAIVGFHIEKALEHHQKRHQRL